MAAIELIASSLELPNGIVIPNRLVKVAMEEGIGFGGGLPDVRHRKLYKRWGEGGWGMIITGNVMVDPAYLATPHCRTIPNTSNHTVSAYSALRVSTLTSLPPNTPPPIMLMQISHSGLQSSSTINLSRAPWRPALGPTATRPDTGVSLWGKTLGWVIWPRVSRQIVDFGDWLEIVAQFVDAAVVAEKAGFDGVQVHSAHGYMLAEYLSPLTNPDCKPLPGVDWRIPIRLHLLYLVLEGIHARTNRSFVKAIKINCSDFVQGGLDEAQSTEIIKEIVSWKMVDCLEISGGNYTNPAFATLESITSARQSLFSHFTSSLLPLLPPAPEGPAIMLTGSLHSRELIADSLRERVCDLAGIGRPACIMPTLPKDVVLNPAVPDGDAFFGGYSIRGGPTMKYLLGGGSSAPRIRSKGKAPISTYLETETVAMNGANSTETTPLLGDSTISPPSTMPSIGSGKSNGVPMVGAGISTFWHEWQLCRMGRGREPWTGMDWFFGGLIYEGILCGLFGALWGLFGGNR